MNKFFETYDIFLSSTLVSLDFSLYRLDRKGGKRVKFLFERKEGLDEAIQGFWGRRLNIEPQILFASLKMLKSRIYSND
ncbi:MAG: hypothetical protein ABID64_00150 [Nitrospirota bacterium]